MKVEMLDTVRHDGAEFTKGDLVTVRDAVGAYFCAAGWARDLDGNVETGTPDKGDVILCPANAVHLHESENVNG